MFLFVMGEGKREEWIVERAGTKVRGERRESKWKMGKSLGGHYEVLSAQR